MLSLRKSANRPLSFIETIPRCFRLRGTTRLVFGTIQPQGLITKRSVHIVAVMRLPCVIIVIRKEVSTRHTHSGNRDFPLILEGTNDFHQAFQEGHLFR